MAATVNLVALQTETVLAFDAYIREAADCEQFWVVERTFAWMNQFRRLRVRY